MKPIKVLATASSLFCISSLTPVLAQTDNDGEASSNLVLDEIIVTGRKREETLQDIPVSASVVSNALIEDAGITDLYDLFEMIPGLHFDEGAEQDRLSALPSIRGIQSNDISSNRAKVTSFIDGMPVLGAQGTIGFNGFQQVEVYRGPQSAAFGRSTFAGAINYVTRDPGEEFAGDVGLNVSDYGTRTINANFDIPITDTFGMLLSASVEDSGSPSEYHATGNFGEVTVTDGITGEEIPININQSDGTEYGSQSGENVSAKFVFEPSDSFKASFTIAHTETDDIGAAELYLTEEERNACFEGNGLVASAGMTSIYRVGTYDCDWDSFRPNYAQHSDEQFLMDNPRLLAALVVDAEAAGAVDNFGGTGLTVEQQILEIARGYSIPEDERGTKSERTRFTAQFDWLLDSGHAIQGSYMHSDETGQRASDSGRIFSYDPDVADIFEDGNLATRGTAPGTGVRFNGVNWTMDSGMGAPRVIEGTETDVKEDYFELRWVSPAEDRLRYVAGFSYYDYEFLDERYGDDMRADGGAPSGYGAILNGNVDLWETLTGSSHFADAGTIGEETVNTAAFFNVNYDLTENITLSAEGRLQSDKVGSTNVESGESAEVKTTSFVPRISATYNLNDQTSLYLQWSQGVNPAGINNSALDLDTIAIVQDGIDQAFIPYDAALAVDNVNNTTGVAGADGFIDIYSLDDGLLYTDSTYTTLLDGESYQADFEGTSDFLSYQEEELTNYEFGFKGSLLNGRLNYAGAVFYIDWKDQLQNGSLDLESPCADNDLVSDPLETEPCIVEAGGAEYFYTSTTAGTTPQVGLNFGDVITKGIELEGTFRVTDNWDVRAQASYLDAKYDDFCDISLYEAADFSNNDAYLEGLGLVVVSPEDGDTLTSTCYDTSGNEVAGQPKFSGSISPSFSTDIGGMRFNSRFDVRHEGSQWVESGNFSKYQGTTTANVSLTLSSDAWSATLYVNNLTDENAPRRVSSGGDDTDVIGLIQTEAQGYPSDDLVDAFGLGDVRVDGATVWDLSRDNYRFSPRTPRTIGLRASYRF